MPTDDFTADAAITTSPLKHYRDRDHQGTETDADIALDEQVGPFPAGTDLATVLREMWELLE